MSCCIALLVSIHWKIKHLNNVLSTLCFYSRSRCRDLGSEVKKQGTVVGDKRSVQGIMGRGRLSPCLGMDHDSGLCNDPSGAFLS